MGDSKSAVQPGYFVADLIPLWCAPDRVASNKKLWPAHIVAIKRAWEESQTLRAIAKDHDVSHEAIRTALAS